MLLTLLASGCIADPVTGDPIKEVGYDLPDIAVTPTSLDFGALDLGTSTERTLTIQNVGEASLEISSFGSDDASWSVDEPDMPFIAPGESLPVTVRWTPAGTGFLDSALHIRSTDADEADVAVPVFGEAHGAVASLSPDPVELGSVDVGCEGEVTVTVANDGDRDLLVEGLALEGASTEFTLVTPTLPLVLTAGTSAEARILYTPLDHATDGGSLRLSSSDEVQPERTVTVSGSGIIGEERSESFVQGSAGQLDLVIVPSELSDPAREAAVEMLDAWLEALDAGGTSWRMIVLDTYGCNATVEDWLDAELAGSERTDTLDLALEHAATNNYYEAAGLQRLDWSLRNGGNGYYANCNQGFFRSAARLVAVGITDGPDESTGVNWLDVADRIEEFRDEDQRLVHAVAPDDPGGCDLYDAGEGWSDLVDEENGSFFSFCGSDWSSYGRTLGALDPGRRTSWELAEPAVADTVVVWEDGSQQWDGWHYDSPTNAVVFDQVPEPDVRVEIAYAVRPATCE